MIYFSLAFPYLNYGIFCWGSATITALKPLQIAQNKCIKTMLKLNIKSNTNSTYFDNNFLQINELYHRQCLTFIHNYHHNRVPPVFQGSFRTIQQIHSHETRISQAGYYTNRVHTDYGLRSPSYSGLKLWNQLSINEKNLSISLFKKFTFHFMKQRYIEWCHSLI